AGPPGNRVLRAFSTDEWLNNSAPIVVTVTVLEDDSTPPAVSWVTPVENLTLPNGTVLTLDVMVTDPQGVAEVLVAFDVNGDGEDEWFSAYPSVGNQFRASIGVDPFFNRGV